jgi:hypothetical protein
MPKSTGYTYVTPQLLNLLEPLSRYMALRTSFLRAMLDCGEQGIIRQLQRRREQGYVFQPNAQRRAYNNIWCPRIHAITAKGELLLRERDIHPLKTTRLEKYKIGSEGSNFAHSMTICDTMASIEIGLRATGCRLISWVEIIRGIEVANPLKLSYDTSYKGVRFQGKLSPDGLFGIEYPDGTAKYFFLEVERKNPVGLKALSNQSALKKAANRSSYLGKLLAYKDIFDKNTFRLLGITTFNILFVAPNDAKVSNMIAVAEEIFGSSQKCLFHSVTVQEDLPAAPPPFPDLVVSPWRRAGHKDLSLAPTGFTPP